MTENVAIAALGAALVWRAPRHEDHVARPQLDRAAARDARARATRRARSPSQRRGCRRGEYTAEPFEHHVVVVGVAMDLGHALLVGLALEEHGGLACRPTCRPGPRARPPPSWPESRPSPVPTAPPAARSRAGGAPAAWACAADGRTTNTTNSGRRPRQRLRIDVSPGVPGRTGSQAGTRGTSWHGPRPMRHGWRDGNIIRVGLRRTLQTACRAAGCSSLQADCPLSRAPGQSRRPGIA